MILLYNIVIAEEMENNSSMTMRVVASKFLRPEDYIKMVALENHQHSGLQQSSLMDSCT